MILVSGEEVQECQRKEKYRVQRNALLGQLEREQGTTEREGREERWKRAVQLCYCCTVKISKLSRFMVYVATPAG
jgi:hypothetical protein